MGTSARDSAVPLLSIRPPRGWAAVHVRDLWDYRDLLFTLAGRDLKVRYKQTALGVIWVVLQPFLSSVIFGILFGVIFPAPSNGVPYFLLTYVGMLGWNLFSGVLGRSSTCLTGNAHLISKVFFPRLVLPLSTVGSNLVDFLVAAAMLAILMPLYHIAIGWGILLLPLWTLLVVMLALGVGLYSAALTVSYRDVQYVLPVITGILMWVSPVVFTAAAIMIKIPKAWAAWGWTIYLNPLSGVLEALRWSVFNASHPDLTFPPLWAIAYTAAFAVVSVWLGAVAFKQMERKFADVI